jgi:hypothetical protein
VHVQEHPEGRRGSWEDLKDAWSEGVNCVPVASQCRLLIAPCQ